jgi:hypothetical protein
VAKNLKQDKELIEAGFEYVTENKRSQSLQEAKIDV